MYITTSNTYLIVSRSTVLKKENENYLFLFFISVSLLNSGQLFILSADVTDHVHVGFYLAATNGEIGLCTQVIFFFCQASTSYLTQRPDMFPSGF